MEEIPPELASNWDKTGINLVPVSSWTMDESGTKRVEVKEVNDKRQITAVFCGTLTGDFLPLQWFTTANLHTATLAINFQVGGISLTHHDTGPRRKQ